MGFARLPPLRLRKKNVGSKEPTFANGFRFLTSTQPCGRLRSFPRTGRQSFDPWGLLRSPSRSPRSCQPASGLPRHSACTLFLHEGAEVGHFAHLSYGRSHTYMCGRAILQGHPCAPAARPHGSCNQASLRESCPQGVTIPNANANFCYLSPYFWRFNSSRITYFKLSKYSASSFALKQKAIAIGA